MLRSLGLIVFFFFFLSGCYSAGKYSDKKAALRGCKQWQADGRMVKVKILSFHSVSKGYSFQVSSRDCVQDDNSRKILGYVYPFVQSGDYEKKYSQVDFRDFLEASSEKGPSKVVKIFPY